MTNNDWNRLRAPREERSARAALDFFLEEVDEHLDGIRNLLALVEGEIENIRKELKE